MKSGSVVERTNYLARNNSTRVVGSSSGTALMFLEQGILSRLLPSTQVLNVYDRHCSWVIMCASVKRLLAGIPPGSGECAFNVQNSN